MVVVVVLVILIGAGVGLWRWRSAPTPVTPVVVTPEVVLPSKPIEPAFVPVEEYASHIASIKSTYSSGRTALGVSASARLGQKEQYQKLVDETLAGLLRLSAPKEARLEHQDRIIALLSIQSLLKQSNPSVTNIEVHEKAVDQSW